jgi:hypothetical protein
MGTLHEDLCTLHEDLCTLHEDLCTLHEDICTLHEDLCTLHEDLFTFMTNSRSILVKIKMFQTKFVHKIKTNFKSNNFFPPKIVPFMR